MSRKTFKRQVDEILIEHCGLNNDYFSSKSSDGENLLLEKELLYDPLDWYEVLSDIEQKFNILINDELLIRQGITYGEFINIFYDEINKSKRK